MGTKISSTLPGDEQNGLHVVAKALRERPKDTHVIVAVIDTKTLTTDVETGAVTPTARILAVEVINPDPNLDDLETAQRLMRRASERRHGGEMLPIEVEDEFTALFRRVDREHMEEREAEEARLRAEAENEQQRLEREEQEALEREAQEDAEAGEQEPDAETADVEVPDTVPDDWDTGPGAPLIREDDGEEGGKSG